eukprot:tig00021167_g19059.t1
MHGAHAYGMGLVQGAGGEDFTILESAPQPPSAAAGEQSAIIEVEREALRPSPSSELAAVGRSEKAAKDAGEHTAAAERARARRSQIHPLLSAAALDLDLDVENDADAGDLDAKPIPGITHGRRSWIVRFLRSLGPGFVVSVGYMDPGNWATDLAAGSTFGYMHLFVILLSSLAAMFLQSLAVRLAVATGRNLAEMCRTEYRPAVSAVLYLLCEAAIVACDLAEVIGGAIALNLLGGVPLPGGVAITAGSTFLVLFGFQGPNGRRFLEISTACFVATVGIGFAVLIGYTNPDPGDTLRGYVPSGTLVTNSEALFLGIGILGATVMPHNLASVACMYLHSAIVGPPGPSSRETPRSALRLLTAESSFALTAAFFVNCAILIVSAAAFHATGHQEARPGPAPQACIQEWRSCGTRTGCWRSSSGAPPAPSSPSPSSPPSAPAPAPRPGLSATITATTAGQIVCEGFLRLRVRPWVRAALTRGLAIVPAMAVACTAGETGLGRLLVLSQVVLSLQLPFAVFPLVLFTSSRRIMGDLRASLPVRVVGFAVATLISGLNAYLLINTCREGLPD